MLQLKLNLIGIGMWIIMKNSWISLYNSFCLQQRHSTEILFMHYILYSIRIMVYIHIYIQKYLL